MNLIEGQYASADFSGQTVTLGQRGRFVLLAVYIASLFLVSRLALGIWAPPFSERGLWFYSGLAAVMLGSLLSTPYFTKPVDTLSNAIAALFTLLPVRAAVTAAGDDVGILLWWILIVAQVALLGTCILTLALKDSTTPGVQKVSRSFYLVCTRLGSAKVVFSSVFFFSIIAFHRSSPREYITISIAGIVLIATRPLENLVTLATRIGEIWTQKRFPLQVGVVAGQEFPSVVLIQETGAAQLSSGDLIATRGSDGNMTVSVVLDHVGYSDGPWWRCFALGAPTKSELAQIREYVPSNIGDGAVYRIDSEMFAESLADNVAWNNRERLVGMVGPLSDVTHLEIEITGVSSKIEEGNLVEVSIGGKTVLYQITNGLTQEEIVRYKNTRGFVVAKARKIGSWNPELRRLEPTPWVPQPNTAVYLAPPVEAPVDRESIGFLPSTDYPVSIDPNHLVTHNTAILGILGVGKTYLALELVERVIWSGAKVVCLDIGDQYRTELEPFFQEADLDNEITGLQAIGQAGRTNVQQNVEEGGSLRSFRNHLKVLMTTFLDETQSVDRIKCFNPARFEVWKQDSKPYQNTASMATLTVVEITRIVTEVCLEVLQEKGMTNDARCFIVFEEAHSLVPEWTSVAADGDKVACAGTSKAILQGRKFGLGCLVVTQRTANVTKSILNQCNTIFALRTYDATGAEFLRHYIGDDYAGVLSALKDRNCVMFGRASSSRDPVMLRLNDRAKILPLLRKKG
ncbi:MAG: DUF87 domain-containing protein [Bryobacteraceae bacterium]